MSLLDEFNRCKGYLEGALEYADYTHTIDDVWQAIISEYAAFFPLKKSAIVAEVVKYPNKKTCRIWLAGGDLDELLDAEKYVAEWGKSHGCDAMEIVGRHGWKKKLVDYKSVATVLAKEL